MTSGAVYPDAARFAELAGRRRVVPVIRRLLADGVLLGFTLFFAAGPAVGLGLLFAGASRRWFTGEKAPSPAAA